MQANQVRAVPGATSAKRLMYANRYRALALILALSPRRSALSHNSSVRPFRRTDTILSSSTNTRTWDERFTEYLLVRSL